MFGVKRVVPANSRLSPTKPGARGFVQFNPVLKLSLAPAPFQTSFPATTVSGRLKSAVSVELSATVTTSVLPPAKLPGPTMTVLVQTLTLPLLLAFGSARVEEPPIGLASTVTLLTVPGLPFVALAVIVRD